MVIRIAATRHVECVVLMSRVNDLDVTTSRENRIDVSAFWGLASGRDRYFLDLAGLCEQVGCQ